MIPTEYYPRELYVDEVDGRLQIIPRGYSTENAVVYVQQAYVDTQPAAPVAPWEDAPGWAMWWAVNAWGDARWYAEKPETDGANWISDSWSIPAGDADLPLGIDWRTTLQRKPEATE